MNTYKKRIILIGCSFLLILLTFCVWHLFLDGDKVLSTHEVSPASQDSILQDSVSKPETERIVKDHQPVEHGSKTKEVVDTVDSDEVYLSREERDKRVRQHQKNAAEFEKRLVQLNKTMQQTEERRIADRKRWAKDKAEIKAISAEADKILSRVIRDADGNIIGIKNEMDQSVLKPDAQSSLDDQLTSLQTTYATHIRQLMEETPRERHEGLLQNVRDELTREFGADFADAVINQLTQDRD